MLLTPEHFGKQIRNTLKVLKFLLYIGHSFPTILYVGNERNTYNKKGRVTGLVPCCLGTAF